MKNISILALYLFIFTMFKSLAISSSDILGEYEFSDPDTGSTARVKIFERENKTNIFDVRIIWSEDMYDEHGKMRLDINNPDEKLRDLPVNQILMIKGLKFNEEEKRWESDYFYHPIWGKTFDVYMSLESSTKLKVHVFWKRPIYGKSAYWTKIK